MDQQSTQRLPASGEFQCRRAIRIATAQLLAARQQRQKTVALIHRAHASAAHPTIATDTLNCIDARIRLLEDYLGLLTGLLEMT
jgi:hypothetical protein